MAPSSLVQRGVDQLNKLLLTKIRGLMLGQLQLCGTNKSSISAAILTTGLVYFVVKNIIYRLYFHPLARLPGPPVDWIPFLGNFRELLQNDTCGPEKKWAKQYGPITRTFGLFNQPRVILNDPLLVKQVLTSQQYDFPKGRRNASFLANILGRGLLVAEGEVHKRQRKLLNPAFSLQSVKGLTSFVYDPTFELFKHWDGALAISDEPIAMEISRWMSHVTLDIIGLAAFGERFNMVKYNGDSNKVNRLSQAYATIFDPNNPQILSILEFLIPSIRSIPTERNRQYNRAVQWLREESEMLVLRGIKRVKSGDSKNDRSLLSIMVNFVDDRTGKEMTPDELREQCMTFLAAG
ncbi:cytochrome P450 [Dichotomocladium elegans]|nr:cytochrome P450 [Dichotomocladium elegans]